MRVGWIIFGLFLLSLAEVSAQSRSGSIRIQAADSATTTPVFPTSVPASPYLDVHWPTACTRVPVCKGCNEYFRTNLRYPEAALAKKVTGDVRVEFLITDTCTIQDIRVTGVGYGCREQVDSLVRNYRDWIPGERNGILVMTRVAFRIGFKKVYGKQDYQIDFDGISESLVEDLPPAAFERRKMSPYE